MCGFESGRVSLFVFNSDLYLWLFLDVGVCDTWQMTQIFLEKKRIRGVSFLFPLLLIFLFLLFGNVYILINTNNNNMETKQSTCVLCDGVTEWTEKKFRKWMSTSLLDGYPPLIFFQKFSVSCVMCHMFLRWILTEIWILFLKRIVFWGWFLLCGWFFCAGWFGRGFFPTRIRA